MIDNKDTERRVLWWTCWITVYLCRIVLLTNGLFYFRPSYKGHGNSTTLSTFFPVLVPVPVITDAVVVIEEGGGGFAMGVAYTCVGVMYLVVAFWYNNLEAGIMMLLQVAVTSIINTQNEFYNEGGMDKVHVQKAQLVAVFTGVMGAAGTIVAAVLFQQKIPTPIEYGTYFLSIITTLSSSSTRIRRTR
mmetsp:Transcript_40840/g.46167  ORF Transcript_40840/g.46167 Transcript_40840/m.46167 type:complete len:189 (+) Transcript_40840:169-735(+)